MSFFKFITVGNEKIVLDSERNDWFKNDDLYNFFFFDYVITNRKKAKHRGKFPIANWM